MEYIVIKHFDSDRMYLKGEKVTFPTHKAKYLIENGYIAEPIKAELKEIKKKTTRKRKTTK